MRVKRGVTTRKKTKKILKQTKGMRKTRRSNVKMAKQAIIKSQTNAYKDRRNRKRDFRSLWITRIRAAAGQHGLNYSTFMGKLKKSDIKLDRKILSEIAVNHPKVFKEILETAKKAE